jgi:hypothetical protein
MMVGLALAFEKLERGVLEIRGELRVLLEKAFSTESGTPIGMARDIFLGR